MYGKDKEGVEKRRKTRKAPKVQKMALLGLMKRKQQLLFHDDFFHLHRWSRHLS